MGQYSSWVAGISFESRQMLAAKIQIGDTLSLLRDPSNKHDAHAVEVYFENSMIGFVPGKHAKWVSEIVECGRPIRVLVRDVIRGGLFFRRVRSVYLTILTGVDAELP